MRSSLEYSCAVWDPYLKKDVQQLEKVQRRAARFVKGKYRWDDGSVSAMISELKWLTLERRRRDKRLALMYKIVHGLVAVPASDILTTSDLRTRSTHKHKFRQLSCKTNQYKHSYYPRTIIDWNKLPEEVAEAPSIDSFKERLSRFD